MEAFAALTAALATGLLMYGFYRLWYGGSASLQSRRAVQRYWRRERNGWEMLARYLGVAHADQLCQHAGRPYGLTGMTLLQFQFFFALVWMALFVLISPVFGVLVGLFAWYMPRVLLSAMAQQRRSQIALELPAFLDLWGLLVTSGEGVETALIEICRRHPDWLLTAEMQRVRDRVSASGLFGESLVEEARVTGSPEFIAVSEQVSHLVGGGGVPSRELAKMAEEMRQQRVTELMQSAGAMSIVGIFPKMLAVFLSLMPVFVAIGLTVMAQISR